MEVMAAKVLPEPVAIWMRARGWLALKEDSSLVVAAIWQSRRPCVGRAGSARSRSRRDWLFQPVPERLGPMKPEDRT